MPTFAYPFVLVSDRSSLCDRYPVSYSVSRAFLFRSRVSCPVAPHSLPTPPVLPSYLHYCPLPYLPVWHVATGSFCIKPSTLAEYTRRRVANLPPYLSYDPGSSEAQSRALLPSSLVVVSPYLAASDGTRLSSRLVSFRSSHSAAPGHSLSFLVPFLCWIRSALELTRIYRPSSAFLNFQVVSLRTGRFRAARAAMQQESQVPSLRVI